MRVSGSRLLVHGLELVAVEVEHEGGVVGGDRSAAAAPAARRSRPPAPIAAA